MSILTRIAGAVIVLGLLCGVLLRFLLRKRRLRLLMVVSLLPWLVHLGVVSIRTLRDGAPLRGALLYIGGSIVLAVACLLVGWFNSQRRPVVTALTPLLLAVAYGGVPFALYLAWLRGFGVRTDALTTVSYVAFSLFASCVLLVLAPRVQAPSLPWQRRRRR